MQNVMITLAPSLPIKTPALILDVLPMIFLDFEAAKLLAARDADLVPTLVTYEAMRRAAALGDLHEQQSEEFAICCRIQKPCAALTSTTSVDAQILELENRLGTIAPGALADLIAVDGNPLANMRLLEEQGRHLDLIMKGGAFFQENFLTRWNLACRDGVIEDEG
jgi:hypothetical protein